MILDRLSRRTAIIAVLLPLLTATEALADGRLEGRVTRRDGTGVSGVSVLINETKASTVTDPSGRFAFDAVPPGTYHVTLALGNDVLTIENVRVETADVRLDQIVDWTTSYIYTVTIYAASRRTERLFEAPASVAVIDEPTIAREAANAQLPKALSSTVGVELTQSGVFDFNVNIRGLNTSLNRRVLTLFDGRDASSVLVGAQEWAAMAMPMDEISRVEVVRGPESALYGANAFNGVIDMTSKAPSDSAGGSAQLSVGDNATGRVSLRHAGAIGRDWFYRAQGAYGRTGDFFVARTDTVEYPGLPKEAVPPATDRTEFINAGARLDHQSSTNNLFTVEGGWARADGNLFLTGAGRPQNRGVQRPWVRSAFQTARWRFSGYYDGRYGRMLSLTAGNTIFDNSTRLHGEVQRAFDFRGGRDRVAAGGALRYEKADTRDDGGVSTILRGVRSAWSGAVYGQIDHQLLPSLRLVFAGRMDDSTIHPAQFSPKAGLVQTLSPTQRLRFTYGHAFQTASFVQYFTRVAAAPPVSLAGVEAALAPALGGVPLNFASVPVLALGNDQLNVEQIDSVEVGYSGALARKMVVGADYYYNRVSDLVTSLLPQVGTSLGRINPQYGPYRPPSSLSPAQQDLVLGTLKTVLPPPLFATMSNDLDGTPIFAVVSYTNFSKVRLQGAELELRYFLNDRFTADGGFSWIDFSTEKVFPEDPVTANAPPHSLRMGIAYTAGRKTAAMTYRWADHFMWNGGIFRGQVPTYSVADLSLGYKWPSRTRVSLNVTNLFNDEHYEIFGGDLLRRTVLLTVAHDW